MVVLFARGRPVRSPWPDDIRLGGFGFRCGYNGKNDTQLVSEVPSNQASVAPTAYGEEGQDPVLGKAFAYRDHSRGFGQRRLRGAQNGRYWYTLNARCRAGSPILGPALTSYTPATTDATNGITRWFEIGSKIYAGAGRYVLDGGTDGTGWTVSRDLGAGKALKDCTVIQGNYASSTRYAFVGMGDTEPAWYFDGTTWTQTSGASLLYSRAFAVTPTGITAFDDSNRLKTCDLDASPIVAANWVNATDRIGTYDHGVTRAVVDSQGALVIAKADDLYTLSVNGDTNRLFASLQFPPATTNGEAMGRWRNDTYTVFGTQTYSLNADAALRRVGPEQLSDNGSAVRGYITALCGTDFFLLGALYNPDTATSYLMEHTGEFFTDEFGETKPVWHGSITAGVSKKITSLHQSTIGGPALHKVLYVGYSDGTLAKYVLACTPDPSDCTAGEVFSTAAGYVYEPRTYFHFPGDAKALHRAIGEGDNFSGQNYATLSYRTSAGSTYTSIGTAFTADVKQSVDFPDGASCTFLDPLITLTNTVSTSSPKLTGLVIETELRTLPKEIFSVNVLCEDGLRKRDGTPYRIGADRFRDLVTSLAGLPGSTSFVSPDEQSRQVTVTLKGSVVAYHSETRKPTAAKKLVLAEVHRIVTTGTYGRIETIARTYGGREAFTYGQQEEL